MSRRRRGPGRTWPVILADNPWRFANYGMAKHGAQRAHYKGMTVAELCALPVAQLTPRNALCFLWCTGPKEAEGAHIEVLRAWGFRPTTAAFTWTKVYPKCQSCNHDWNEHAPTEHDVPGRCGHRDPLPRGAALTGRAELDGIACPCRGFSPKLYFGTGCYTGGGTERVWLGVKGGGFSAARFEKDIRHSFIAPLPCYPGTKKKRHSAKPEEIARRIERMAAGPYLELFRRGPARRGWSAWGNETDGSVACLLDAHA